ncbi:sugar ABC transporter permease [Eubacteriales bacterium OttesenSCG-928-A19]|nr:sugar ABC transporter permease [Eubacteriales bacterium OttesenSCG-928-A19]
MLHASAKGPVINPRRPRVRRWGSPVAGYLFIAPWLLGFFILTVWPMAMSLFYSLNDFNLLSSPVWVGLDNYRRILTQDTVFRKSLGVTFRFVLLSVPVKLVCAMIVALILNRNIRGISIYRTLFYLPTLIGGSVAVSILWRNIWGADGFINQLLGLIGVKGMSWISNPSTALYTLIALGVWQFGSPMVVYLAGLKQIPTSLYEASSIDGASKPRQFFSITLPMLSSVLLFNLVLQTIGAFQMFTQAYIITNKGRPMNSTLMYSLYIYERGFTRYEMGYAAALAWILLAMIAVITVIIFASSRLWVFYESEGG